MIKQLLDNYDFNLPLLDAFEDRARSEGDELSMTRRMLAGAAMPEGLDSAYYLTMELFQAFEMLCEDRRQGVNDGLGAAKIREIIDADSTDYQRRIYYIVSDLAVYEALGDLAWLVRLTGERARMFPVIREAGAMMPLIPGSMRDAGSDATWANIR